jgi:histidine ammonia-lyase
MPAAQALQAAGLKPLRPDDLIYTPYLGSNAYGAGQAALLAADARQALDWADLVYAMDLDAMNSSVTPLATPVQTLRPFRYANLDAARVLDMLRGGYLLDNDPTRIIQDPESLRASFSRQGAAWKAWATLRDTVLLQINSSDHNPAALVGASPQDSWELSSPQMMKYYVKGGPLSHGQHGYVLSNANWDPYPLANEVEAFSNALANMDVAVVQRIYRLGSPFFTVVAAKDVLSPQELASAAPMGMGYDPTALWQEIQSLARPLTPEGNPIGQNVEELQAQTSLKIGHARQAVDDTLRLLGEDLLTATYWLDVRHKQDPARAFGAAPTSAWSAFRKVSPWQAPAAGRPAAPDSDLGYAFLKSNTAAAFYPPAAQAIDAGLEP